MPRSSTTVQFETLADILEQMGGIDPARIRATPTPGKATEKDLIRLNDRKEKIYELVDGVLVEKILGFPESTLALWLGHLLQTFLDSHDLGLLAGADGATRLMPGLVRVPDLSFVSWDRLPVRGMIPQEPILGLAPDLAIEVLSKGNTREEMNRKLREYFLAGVRRVWFVDLVNRSVEDFTSPEVMRLLTEDQTLEGGELLPGLQLPLARIFTRVVRSEKRTARKKTRKRQQKPR